MQVSDILLPCLGYVGKRTIGNGRQGHLELTGLCSMVGMLGMQKHKYMGSYSFGANFLQKQIKGDKKSYGLGQKPFGGFNEWLGGRGSRF